MLIAIYKDTQTLNNVRTNKTTLLQLLTEELAPVIRVCGQTSGKDTDKIKRLQKRYDLEQEDSLFYFKKTAGFILLSTEQLIETSGDHYLLVGKVVKTKNLNDETILTTTYLRDEGYTR